MKAYELIAELQKYDPEIEVVAIYDCGYGTASTNKVAYDEKENVLCILEE